MTKYHQRINFPKQCIRKISKRPEEFLLICFYDPYSISTVPEVIASIQSESRYSIIVLNLFEHRIDTGLLKLYQHLNLDRFSGIIIHNSVSYNIENLRSLDKLTVRKLNDFEGIKVLFKQDENYRFRELADYIGEVGFDVVYTCLPESDIEKIYPRAKVGTPRFVRMLTGYVTPTLRAISPTMETRPIDIGYRGSIQPLSFGRLAYEKRKIGDDMARLLVNRNLSLDISSRWGDRLGGNSWFDFLLSCKSTLGTESGASIFDLEGNLDCRCRAAEEKLGSFREDQAYAESFLSELADLENKILYNQISPRHFEAAATGTLQLLYPGKYSGIFKAGRHFFALNRDYSNLDEAIELLLDEKKRIEITQTAYDEIIQNKTYWIENFVEQFDTVVFEALRSKDVLQRSIFKTSVPYKNALLIAAHEPSIDPRLGWIEEAAPKDIAVHQLGILPSGRSKKIHYSGRGSLIMAFSRSKYPIGFHHKWYPHAMLSPAGMAGLTELLFIENALRLSESDFCTLFSAPYECARVSQFRWYLQYILDTSATLLSTAIQIRGIHAIIATDLDTLAAGLVLKGALNIPLLYDAHEYWPEADPESLEFEKQFWIGMEHRLVTHTDYRQTVSPGIAEIMTHQYGLKFEVTPNAEPKGRVSAFFDNQKGRPGKCQFLYQGGFAIGRGIDLLIKIWPRTNEAAVLILRGPENSYKNEMQELARSTGLLGDRILFLDPVAESQLIQAAAEFDVGLLPYTPMGANYKNCCPNKLSQYMAAGLAIVANKSSFVTDVIRNSGCGRIIDFVHINKIVDVINELTINSIERNLLSRNARQFFLNEFNWESVSKDFYKNLEAYLANSPIEPIKFFVLEDKPHLLPPKHSKLYVFMQNTWHSLPATVRRPLLPLAKRIEKYLM
jgi:glycosyltransferase involved in cell wall biosynthesis